MPYKMNANLFNALAKAIKLIMLVLLTLVLPWWIVFTGGWRMSNFLTGNSLDANTTFILLSISIYGLLATMRMILGERDQDRKLERMERYHALAVYNGEVARGLVHTPEYVERMKKLQAERDEEYGSGRKHRGPPESAASQ